MFFTLAVLLTNVFLLSLDSEIIRHPLKVFIKRWFEGDPDICVQWLPVSVVVHFKILLFVFKSLKRLAA